VTSKPCRGCQPLVVVDFAHDAVVAALARTRKHATARRGGVDLNPRESTEAGGHAGETTTMVLVPEVVDLDGARPLGPVPVC
jgi:NAD(P)H-dependent flavin oxidoreductase YrpB (nitropropane dioxygenase family)